MYKIENKQQFNRHIADEKATVREYDWCYDNKERVVVQFISSFHSNLYGRKMAQCKLKGQVVILELDNLDKLVRSTDKKYNLPKIPVNTKELV
jgi:hypothetical protein